MSDRPTRIDPPPAPVATRLDSAGALSPPGAEAVRATQLDGQPIDPLQRGLPSALAARFTVRRELPATGAEADLLVVEALGDQTRYMAKVYRLGRTPKTDVIEQVAVAAPEHVIRLIEHGLSDGRWYELLEYAECGSLRDLVLHEGPRLDPEVVSDILRELAAALESLHASNIVHRDLKPENVLVRTRAPLDLVFTDFGISSIVDDSIRFSQFGSRTTMYAAPEAHANAVSPALDYWSLGMMIVELLNGRHPFEDLSEAVMSRHLMTRPVPLGDVPPRWNLLCRGLLLRDDAKRWGASEIQRWLRGDTALEIADDRTELDGPPYPFLDNEFGTLASLAAAFAEHWEAARREVARRYIHRWLESDPRKLPLQRFVDDVEDDKSLNVDGRLFRIITRFDPTRPPSYYGYDLTRASLCPLAVSAAQGNARAREVVATVYEQRMLEAYASITGDEQMGDVGRGWRNAGAAYAAARQRLIQAGAPASDTGEDRSQTLAGLLLGSVDPDFVASVRATVQQSVAEVGPSVEWLAALGEPSALDGPALLALSNLVPIARREAIERRRAELMAARAEAELRVRRLENATWVAWISWGGGFILTIVVTAVLEAMFPPPAWNTSDVAALVGFLLLGIFVACSLTFNELILDPARARLRTLQREIEHGESDATQTEARFYWRPVIAAGLVASLFLTAYLITAPNAVSTPMPAPPPPVQSVTGIVIASTLNVRAAPSSVGHVVARVERNTPLQVEARQGEWLQINLGPLGGTGAGWVHQDFVSIDNSNAGLTTDRSSADVPRPVDLMPFRVRVLEANPPQFLHSAWSADGALVAAAGSDMYARVWEASTGRVVASLVGGATPWGSPRGYSAIALSADNRIIAAGREDGQIDVWESSGRLLTTLVGHSDPVHSLAFDPAATLLASGSGGRKDYSARLWNLATGALVHTLDARNIVTAVAFAPSGRVLAAAAWDKVLIIDRATFTITNTFVAGDQHERASALRFSRDGGTLLISGDDGIIRFVRPSDTEPFARFVENRGSENHIQSLSFDADEAHVIAASEYGFVSVWSIATGLLERSYGFGSGIAAVAVSPDGRFITSHVPESGLGIWDLSRKPVRRETVQVRASAGWIDTNMMLTEGTRINVAASGSVHPCVFLNCGDKRYQSWVGPEGFVDLPKMQPNALPDMALIGRIGNGAPFYIGSKLATTVSTGGPLQLFVNDGDNSQSDNSGSFGVSVEIIE